MPVIRYLSHPQVRIDPKVPVPRWGLNDVGAARVAALAASPGALRATSRVISSEETKAIKTAEPLAAAVGAAAHVLPDMHENDRSATGFLPPDEFEATADQFFAHPAHSVRGWESAMDAQARILRAVEACLRAQESGDLLLVGHGGVGTLLWCALSGEPINRRFDQGPGGGGNFFAFNAENRRPAHGWRPMETLQG